MKLLLIILFLPINLYAQSYLKTFGLSSGINGVPVTISNFNIINPISPQAGTMLHLISDTAVNGRLTFDTYNNNSTAGSAFTGRRARGTSIAPLAVQVDDILNVLNGQGYGDNSFPTNSSGSVAIRAEAIFTNISKPTYIDFLTTAAGNILNTSKMKLSSTGILSLSSYNSTGFLQTNSSGIVSTALLTSSQVTVALGYIPVSSNYSLITNTYTTLATDNLIEVSGTFTITLLTAIGNSGKQFTITNSGTGIITLASIGSQKIGNSSNSPTSISISQGSSVTIFSNGSNWRIK